jgi:hypothetical protein
VEQLEADRRAMDARIAAIEKAEGGAPVNAGPEPLESAALEPALAAVSAERQRLLEAYAAAARQSQARSNQLEERLRAIDERYSQDRALLAELYSARADLTRSEMQTVQRVLVAAVKGAPSRTSESGDYARFLEALRNTAGQMNPPPDPSLLAPHALLDALASQVPAVSSSPDARTWVPFTNRKISASRELGGADKRALAAAWLERLRRQPDFADMVRRLDTSDAVSSASQALASLFVAGVMGHTKLVEQRLDDGAIGIQVTILGRDYRLDADGSLVPLPEN